jgi:16S rRNA (guanine527-N7)-methyltransferase
LVVVGGRMLALKGAAAAEEVAAHSGEVVRLGGATPVVRQCGLGLLDPPTTVVEIVKERVVPASGRATAGRSPGRRGARRR